jgi:hypothetical protein
MLPMHNFLSVIILSLISLAALAKEERVILTTHTSRGTSKVQAYQYLNHWGRPEIRLEGNALPKFGSANPILGYGRDTDDDGKIDTWFMIDEDKGLLNYTLPSQSIWAHDVIQKKLIIQYSSYSSSVSFSLC